MKKRRFRLAAFGSILLFVLAAGLQSIHTAAQEPVPAQSSGIWFCPMHPDVTASAPGKCWKCEMTLLAGDPSDTRDYTLAFGTVPAAVHARAPFRLNLEVVRPGSTEIVKDFEVVHDKRYHLFLVSEDLTSFQHLHPSQRTDGSWSIDATVPKAGYYRILSDFVPSGGGPQFLSQPLVTAGFEGDADSEAAHLVADSVLTRTVGTITASVTLQPPVLVAGEYGHMHFSLTDAATGAPVADLQPYLGAFGHMLMMSEDLADYVHAHPTPGPTVDVSRGVAGPDVEFEGYMPRPGVYRAWTQFQRGGQIVTVPFDFRVYSLEESVTATGPQPN